MEISTIKAVKASFSKLEFKKKILFESLTDYSNDMLSKPEKAGKWSVNQVLVHLYTSEQGMVKYIQYKLNRDQLFSNSNMISWFRYGMLKSALVLPFKYKVPKVLESPNAEIDLNEIKNEYQKTRTEMSVFLENFPPELAGKLIFRHPAAGRFNLIQTMKFMNDHFDRHVKQIERIKTGLKKYHID